MLQLDRLTPYLRGHQFDNSLIVRLDYPRTPVRDRVQYLTELVRGKTVLHLGFADHLPLISDKDRQGRWLHRQLRDSSARCVGLDIDQAAVEFVKLRMNIPDVFCLDITADVLPTEVAEGHWDYVILGELLEHIDDPVAFLSSIRKRFCAIANDLVITVPNAFDIANVGFLRRNCEYINSDHRYWFTPYTLAKVAVRAGFTPRDLVFAHNLAHASRLQRWLLRRYPMLHETLIGVFAFAE